MRKINFAEISIFIVNRIFHWRFRIARFTKQSKILKMIIEKILFEDDETVIIPNTEKIAVNKTIDGEKSEFLPTDVLKEVIRQCDDIVIMDKCLCRTSADCKDYPQDIGCIFLGPTSKKIPRTICHEASVKEALEHVNKADEAGLSHLVGRNKIDSIWMNVRPRKKLLTICHCCPCCCLWKVLPDLDNEISAKVEKLDGVKLHFDKTKCVKCLKCVNDICMPNAISFENKEIKIDLDKCLGCGLCANVCKKDAITITYNNDSIKTVINRMYNLIS